MMYVVFVLAFLVMVRAEVGVTRLKLCRLGPSVASSAACHSAPIVSTQSARLAEVDLGWGVAMRWNVRISPDSSHSTHPPPAAAGTARTSRPPSAVTPMSGEGLGSTPPQEGAFSAWNESDCEMSRATFRPSSSVYVTLR